MAKKDILFPAAIFNYEEANAVLQSIILENESPFHIKKLKEIASFVEPFDVELGKNTLKNVRLHDKGIIRIKGNYDEIFLRTRKIVEDGKLPITFANNHLVTLYNLGICDTNTAIVIFDAHADCKQEYENKKFSKATWLRRFIEFSNPEQIALIGIRSLDEDELYFLDENEVFYLSASEIKKDFSGSIEKFDKFMKNFSDVFVSFDVDVVDPSIIPGVNFPEPLGLNLYDIFAFFDLLKEKRFRSIDLVEFKHIRGLEFSEITITKILYRLLYIAFG